MTGRAECDLLRNIGRIRCVAIVSRNETWNVGQ